MNVFLTRLQLREDSKEVMRDLQDVHRLHQRVMGGFPESTDERSRLDYGVLYRVEHSDSGLSIIIQSKVLPDWAGLPDGYVQRSDDFGFESTGIQTISMAPLIERLVEGSVWKFRMRANPTRSVLPEGSPPMSGIRGKRVPLRRDDSRQEWLERRALASGFELLDVSGQRVAAVVQRDPVFLRGLRSGKTVTVEGVTFEGLLRVADTERFREALLEGVGPAKAYGFGLLSLAPY